MGYELFERNLKEIKKWAKKHTQELTVPLAGNPPKLIALPDGKKQSVFDFWLEWVEEDLTKALRQLRLLDPRILEYAATLAQAYLFDQLPKVLRLPANDHSIEKMLSSSAAGSSSSPIESDHFTFATKFLPVDLRDDEQFVSLIRAACDDCYNLERQPSLHARNNSYQALCFLNNMWHKEKLALKKRYNALSRIDLYRGFFINYFFDTDFAFDSRYLNEAERAAFNFSMCRNVTLRPIRGVISLEECYVSPGMVEPIYDYLSSLKILLDRILSEKASFFNFVFDENTSDLSNPRLPIPSCNKGDDIEESIWLEARRLKTSIDKEERKIKKMTEKIQNSRVLIFREESCFSQEKDAFLNKCIMNLNSIKTFLDDVLPRAQQLINYEETPERIRQTQQELDRLVKIRSTSKYPTMLEYVTGIKHFAEESLALVKRGIEVLQELQAGNLLINVPLVSSATTHETCSQRTLPDRDELTHGTASGSGESVKLEQESACLTQDPGPSCLREESSRDHSVAVSSSGTARLSIWSSEREADSSLIEDIENKETFVLNP